MAAFSTDDSSSNIDDLLNEERAPRTTSWFWVALSCAFIACCAFWLGAYAQQHTARPSPVGPFSNVTSQKPSPLVVHVAGSVTKPGVYSFPFDARVRDAIRKAGGPTKDADVNALNLAAWLEDGIKIDVPQKPKPAPEVSDDVRVESTPFLPDELAISNKPLTTLPPAAVASPRIEAPVTSTTKAEKSLREVPRASTPTGEASQNADPKYFEKQPLNLNKATQEQLELLPGIGPAMAQKILVTRKEKGGFKSVDELNDVPGIGEKKLEKIRPLVTVG